MAIWILWIEICNYYKHLKTISDYIYSLVHFEVSNESERKKMNTANAEALVNQLDDNRKAAILIIIAHMHSRKVAYNTGNIWPDERGPSNFYLDGRNDCRRFPWVQQRPRFEVPFQFGCQRFLHPPPPIGRPHLDIPPLFRIPIRPPPFQNETIDLHAAGQLAQEPRVFLERLPPLPELPHYSSTPMYKGRNWRQPFYRSNEKHRRRRSHLDDVYFPNYDEEDNDLDPSFYNRRLDDNRQFRHGSRKPVLKDIKRVSVTAPPDVDWDGKTNKSRSNRDIENKDKENIGKSCADSSSSLSPTPAKKIKLSSEANTSSAEDVVENVTSDEKQTNHLTDNESSTASGKEVPQEPAQNSTVTASSEHDVGLPSGRDTKSVTPPPPLQSLKPTIKLNLLPSPQKDGRSTSDTKTDETVTPCANNKTESNANDVMLRSTVVNKLPSAEKINHVHKNLEKNGTNEQLSPANEITISADFITVNRIDTHSTFLNNPIMMFPDDTRTVDMELSSPDPKNNKKTEDDNIQDLFDEFDAFFEEKKNVQCVGDKTKLHESINTSALLSQINRIVEEDSKNKEIKRVRSKSLDLTRPLQNVAIRKAKSLCDLSTENFNLFLKFEHSIDYKDDLLLLMYTREISNKKTSAKFISCENKDSKLIQDKASDIDDSKKLTKKTVIEHSFACPDEECIVISSDSESEVTKTNEQLDSPLKLTHRRNKRMRIESSDEERDLNETKQQEHSATTESDKKRPSDTVLYTKSKRHNSEENTVLHNQEKIDTTSTEVKNKLENPSRHNSNKITSRRMTICAEPSASSGSKTVLLPKADYVKSLETKKTQTQIKFSIDLKAQACKVKSRRKTYCCEEEILQRIEAFATSNRIKELFGTDYLDDDLTLNGQVYKIDKHKNESKKDKGDVSLNKSVNVGNDQKENTNIVDKISSTKMCVQIPRMKENSKAEKRITESKKTKQEQKEKCGDVAKSRKRLIDNSHESKQRSINKDPKENKSRGGDRRESEPNISCNRNTDSKEADRKNSKNTHNRVARSSSLPSGSTTNKAATSEIGENKEKKNSKPSDSIKDDKNVSSSNLHEGNKNRVVVKQKGKNKEKDKKATSKLETIKEVESQLKKIDPKLNDQDKQSTNRIVENKKQISEVFNPIQESNSNGSTTAVSTKNYNSDDSGEKPSVQIQLDIRTASVETLKNTEFFECSVHIQMRPTFCRITGCSYLENDCSDTACIVDGPSIECNTETVKQNITPAKETDDVIEIIPAIPMIDLTKDEDKKIDLSATLTDDAFRTEEGQEMLTLYRADETVDAAEEVQAVVASICIDSVLTNNDVSGKIKKDEKPDEEENISESYKNLVQELGLERNVSPNMSKEIENGQDSITHNETAQGVQSRTEAKGNLSHGRQVERKSKVRIVRAKPKIIAPLPVPKSTSSSDIVNQTVERIQGSQQSATTNNSQTTASSIPPQVSSLVQNTGMQRITSQNDHQTLPHSNIQCASNLIDTRAAVSVSSSNASIGIVNQPIERTQQSATANNSHITSSIPPHDNSLVQNVGIQLITSQNDHPTLPYSNIQVASNLMDTRAAASVSSSNASIGIVNQTVERPQYSQQSVTANNSHITASSVPPQVSSLVQNTGIQHIPSQNDHQTLPHSNIQCASNLIDTRPAVSVSSSNTSIGIVNQTVERTQHSQQSVTANIHIAASSIPPQESSLVQNMVIQHMPSQNGPQALPYSNIQVASNLMDTRAAVSVPSSNTNQALSNLVTSRANSFSITNPISNQNSLVPMPNMVPLSSIQSNLPTNPTSMNTVYSENPTLSALVKMTNRTDPVMPTNSTSSIDEQLQVMSRIFCKHLYFCWEVTKAQHVYRQVLSNKPHQKEDFLEELKIFADFNERKMSRQGSQLAGMLPKLKLPLCNNLQKYVFELLKKINNTLTVEMGLTDMASHVQCLVMFKLMKPYADKYIPIPFFNCLLRYLGMVFNKSSCRMVDESQEQARTGLTVAQRAELLRQIKEYRKLHDCTTSNINHVLDKSGPPNITVTRGVTDNVFLVPQNLTPRRQTSYDARPDLTSSNQVCIQPANYNSSIAGASPRYVSNNGSVLPNLAIGQSPRYQTNYQNINLGHSTSSRSSGSANHPNTAAKTTGSSFSSNANSNNMLPNRVVNSNVAASPRHVGNNNNVIPNLAPQLVSQSPVYQTNYQNINLDISASNTTTIANQLNPGATTICSNFRSSTNSDMHTSAPRQYTNNVPARQSENNICHTPRYQTENDVQPNLNVGNLISEPTNNSELARRPASAQNVVGAAYKKPTFSKSKTFQNSNSSNFKIRLPFTEPAESVSNRANTITTYCNMNTPQNPVATRQYSCSIPAGTTPNSVPSSSTIAANSTTYLNINTPQNPVATRQYSCSIPAGTAPNSVPSSSTIAETTTTYPNINAPQNPVAIRQYGRSISAGTTSNSVPSTFTIAQPATTSTSAARTVYLQNPPITKTINKQNPIAAKRICLISSISVSCTAPSVIYTTMSMDTLLTPPASSATSTATTTYSVPSHALPGTITSQSTDAARHDHLISSGAASSSAPSFIYTAVPPLTVTHNQNAEFIPSDALLPSVTGNPKASSTQFNNQPNQNQPCTVAVTPPATAAQQEVNPQPSQPVVQDEVIIINEGAVAETETPLVNNTGDSATVGRTEDELETIDLTWIDDMDVEQIQEHMQLVFVKKEEPGDEAEGDNTAAMMAPSPADSGISSPPLQTDDCENTVYVEKMCICGETAAYLCDCKTAWYCSEDCQLRDWSSHCIVCGSAGGSKDN